jgi:hypothetical protein
MADGESDTGHWSPGSRWRLASGVWRLASGVYENALERPFYPEKCASKRQKRPAIGLDSLRVSGLAWSDPGPAFRRQPPDARPTRGLEDDSCLEKCGSKRQKRPEIGLDSLRVSGLAWSDPDPAFRRQPPDASDLRGAWKVTLASKSAALSVKSGPKSDSILCESVGWRGPTPQTYPMSF